MKIAYISLQDENKMDAAIDEAVACLERGEVIVYPTDTVYGLGCDAMNALAVEKIFRLKSRDAGKPLSVIVKDLSAIKKLAFIDRIREEIVYELLPGPFTLIFPGVKNIPQIVTAGHNSIGVRIPDHPVTRKLSEKFAGPIITTSVNVSGNNPFNDPFIIVEYFKDLKDKPDLILDCGKIINSRPSVVIDVTQKRPQITRSGMMSVEEIRDLLEKLQKF
jgi:tRNA threonylcarbamoyl adenosine modification protein (Sua5/YciO/YrdC/YwlC family)